ncbi:2-oxo-4-hydroxy-4-carboxy-5-ureidoimidazoline decarboxylase [Zhongshania sp.]|uniref:2-oxo-4-hydroxy-4-carboxy-5-ureidoimidazoline decarboxylase n=1 Tax=Zhongshania sp. TaxID=1971902 RepID=UPI003562AF3E
MSEQPRLAHFNALPAAQAEQLISQCCAAKRWAQAMVEGRPYTDLATLLNAAEHIWASMTEADLLEAFLAHPQIGNVDSLREKYASTKTLAAGEQSAVNNAEEAVLTALCEGNQRYIERNGFIFIVCATGKSAAQMLALLSERLANSRVQELQIAAEEQGKITALRLNKQFS